jgi:hypothetical protein
MHARTHAHARARTHGGAHTHTHARARAHTHTQTLPPPYTRVRAIAERTPNRDSGGAKAESRGAQRGTDGCCACAAELSAMGGTAEDGRRANRIENRF